jgi:hypothetical protein
VADIATIDNTISAANKTARDFSRMLVLSVMFVVVF